MELDLWTIIWMLETYAQSSARAASAPNSRASTNIFLDYIYLMYVLCLPVVAAALTWRSQDNLEEVVLSFYPLGSLDPWTPAAKRAKPSHRTKHCFTVWHTGSEVMA